MQNKVLGYLLKQLSSQRDWQYSITVSEWETDFLRFYNSQTNYSISKKRSAFDVAIYKDKRSYGFSIDNPNVQSVRNALKSTKKIIDILPQDPDYVDVETDKSKNLEKKKKNNIDVFPANQKIKILRQIAHEAQNMGFSIFGTFICNYQYSNIINSNGLDKHQWQSPVFLEIKAVQDSNQVTVLDCFGGESYASLNVDKIVKRLVQKMKYALNELIDLNPGEYDVILSPRCIAELMLYLSGSMTAVSYDNKTSWFMDKNNKRVLPSRISIYDDPADKDLISFEYNNDGHIYRPLKLIDKGIFKSFMCSNYYAHKTGLPKNGNTGSCLILKKGDVSLSKMLTSIDKGLYISSFHYMNFINEKETSITGLTRDGTFLIDRGKITKVVNNLRFTDKIIRVFQNIIALENKYQIVPFSDNYEFFDIVTAKAPHVLVKKFNITSSTKTI